MLTAKSPVVEREMFRLVPAPGVIVKAPVEVISPPLTAKSPEIARFPVVPASARVSNVLAPSVMVKVSVSLMTMVGVAAEKVMSPVTVRAVERIAEEIVGESEKTSEPVPVSSVTEAARLAEEMLVVNCPPMVVATNLLEVKSEKVMVPEEVIPVAPVSDPDDNVAVPSVKLTPCTVPVEVIDPLSIVPILERLPLLNAQLPVRFPSVIVLVPKSRVVTLAVVRFPVVYVRVVPSSVVMVPVEASMSPETSKLPVMLVLPLTLRR